MLLILSNKKMREIKDAICLCLITELDNYCLTKSSNSRQEDPIEMDQNLRIS